MFKLLIGAAIGAAAAWFLDPNQGSGRRNTTRDKTMKYARKGKDQAVQQASSATGQVKGKAEAAGGQSDRGPAEERLNDPALQAKVETEIFRPEGAPKDKVSVNVEDGVVYLRGELEDQASIDGLREAAGKVDGVRGVENLLHKPGESAPVKEESHSG